MKTFICYQVHIQLQRALVDLFLDTQCLGLMVTKLESLYQSDAWATRG